MLIDVEENVHWTCKRMCSSSLGSTTDPQIESHLTGKLNNCGFM